MQGSPLIQGACLLDKQLYMEKIMAILIVFTIIILLLKETSWNFPPGPFIPGGPLILQWLFSRVSSYLGPKSIKIINNLDVLFPRFRDKVDDDLDVPCEVYSSLWDLFPLCDLFSLVRPILKYGNAVWPHG